MSEIGNEDIVKAYAYGDTVELTTANGQQKQKIKVISGRRYVNLETGEIHDMDTSNTTRFDNLKTVKQTMKKLRRLVAHNFTGGVSQLWITLTYKVHITDPDFSRTTTHETHYGIKEYTTEFYDNIKSLSDTFSGETDRPQE